MRSFVFELTTNESSRADVALTLAREQLEEIGKLPRVDRRFVLLLERELAKAKAAARL